MKIPPLTSAEMDQIRAAVRLRGERAVIEVSGTSRNALYRALAGLSVHAGTTLLLRTALPALAPSPVLSGAA